MCIYNIYIGSKRPTVLNTCLTYKNHCYVIYRWIDDSPQNIEYFVWTTN